MGKSLEYGVLLDYYGKLLTNTQRHLADLYYNADLSFAEIADNMGITRQGVYDSIHRAEAMLYEYEQTLGLMKRANAYKAAAEKISYLCSCLKKTGNTEAIELGKRIAQIVRQFIQEDFDGV